MLTTIESDRFLHEALRKKPWFFWKITSIFELNYCLFRKQLSAVIHQNIFFSKIFKGLGILCDRRHRFSIIMEDIIIRGPRKLVYHESVRKKPGFCRAGSILNWFLLSNLDEFLLIMLWILIHPMTLKKKTFMNIQFFRALSDLEPFQYENSSFDVPTVRLEHALSVKIISRSLGLNSRVHPCHGGTGFKHLCTPIWISSIQLNLTFLWSYQSALLYYVKRWLGCLRRASEPLAGTVFEPLPELSVKILISNLRKLEANLASLFS